MLMLRLFTVKSFRIEEGVIFISDETPSELKSQFLDSGLILDITDKSFEEIFSTLESQVFLFMVDVTCTRSYLGLLNSLSLALDMIYLTLSYETTEFPYRFFIHNTENEEVECLSAFIKYLKVENYIILSSSNQLDQIISESLIRITQEHLYSHITYPEGLTQSVAENIVGRMIKAKGIKALIIIDSSDSLQTIEKAMQTKNYIKSGTIVIYSTRSFSSINTNGTLKLKEYMSENAENKYELIFYSLINRLAKVQNYIQTTLKSSLNKENLKISLSAIYNEDILYTITNVKNGKNVPVGKIIKKTLETKNIEFLVNITDEIYYPGNITEITSMKTKIVISIANGTHDPYNSINFPGFAYMYLGASYAVSRSNLYNEIPNFYIELFPTDCGIFWYDPFWYQNCYKPILDSMGIAILTSFYGNAIQGNIFTLRTLSRVIPQISPLGVDPALDNKKLYPELVKLETALKNYIYSKITTIMSLGYTDIIYIASNETEQLKQKSELSKTIIISSGMKIVNDNDHMYIKYNYTRTDFEYYADFFYYIKNTRCTVFFLSIFSNDMIIEALYDVGLRKGDFFFIFTNNVVRDLDGVEETYAIKRKELAEGCLILSYKEYVGDLGQKIQNELSQRFGDINYMCMTYDTVSVVKEAVKYLLSIGEDYENYDKLMNAIRKNKFEGCLGNVYFDKEENTRASSQFLVQQIVYNTTTKIFETIDISYLDRFSSQIFTLLNPYVWPTDSAPPNYRPYNPCPFDNYQIKSSSKGKEALYIFSSFFVILCLFSCIYTYFRSQKHINPITDKQIISLDDYAFFLYFPLQFFQIIAMGPDQDAYKHFVKNFQTVFSFDFNLYFNFTFGKFWFLFYGVFGFTIFWIIECLVYWTRLGRSMKKLWWTSTFAEISRVIVIFGGHIGFMPIISMLMNIYICINSIGDNLTDTYLKQDCKTICYKDNHKTMLVLSTIVLLLFIPLAVYYRSLWENEQETLHIKTKTSYFLLLSLSQVILAVLNKTLKIYNQNIHGIVCCCIIIAMIIITILLKPYNYMRATISQCISLVTSLCAILTATIFRNFSNINIWIFVEVFSIIIVLIIGVLIMKRFPQLLISEKGVDISTLFLFQFCKNYKRYIKDPKSLKVSNNDEKYKMIESSKSP
ncbi:hypothetical protein SteCoe_26308 [Stentor coeruleus]|uniref:Receptor ligand binding region domain-containing protein n=1 Tax=Stentor coeruleus TaxID=5963 RepID=A0A1R2BD66_9CILI|nr:hypothetical protein SteCoe_26308 [Stentor coeruleus]